MDKVVTTILQGSVVTQTVLDGLSIYSPVTDFIQFTYAKNYENWLQWKPCAVFLAHTVCAVHTSVPSCLYHCM